MAKKKAKKITASSAKTAPLIDPGRAAPDFTLPDQRGKPHRLRSLRGQWVVLYFYPKDHTSGCTKQACGFRDARRRFNRSDAVIFGISPDTEASHRNFASKYRLGFVLLADTDRKVCARYGIWQQKSLYGRKYMGVVRTTYLIDPAGKVAHRFDKVKVADHEQAVLEKIRELRA